MLQFITKYKAILKAERTEVKEPIAEVMEMDFGMFGVVDSEPQRKLFTHKSTGHYVAAYHMEQFNKSL